MDTCPGCGPQHLDLSECGIALLAGTVSPEELVQDEAGRLPCPEVFETADYLQVSVEVMR